tara:strand:+ start:2497 stop:2751 length:255 start_codon:yes stop_codon:yes gene_type:complete
MNTHITKIDLGVLEDLEAEFDIDIETYPAEPYSTGASRGMEKEVTAHLRKIKINDLELDVHDSIKAFGHDAIVQAELRVQEDLQ